MRSIWRTVDPDILRDVGALAAAAGVVGASFGAIAVAAGVPWWLASVMSVLVFAGASQFALVAIVASGGGVVAAVLGSLLLNARHVPLGVAISDVFRGSWRARLVGSHLMTDESVAFALAQSTPARRRTAYWATGFALLAAWNVGVLTGAFAGQVIGDPAALGLDAAFPAALLALLLPSLRQPRARVVAAVGAGIALATTPLLPAGVPVLLALAALPAALLVRRPPAPARPAQPAQPARGGPAQPERDRPAHPHLGSQMAHLMRTKRAPERPFGPPSGDGPPADVGAAGEAAC